MKAYKAKRKSAGPWGSVLRNMVFRLVGVAGLMLALAACQERVETSSSRVDSEPVDLHGRLELDVEIMARRQEQGMSNPYYKRVLTIDGKDVDFSEFLARRCPASSSTDELCRRAWRIKRIDDVAGAARILPAGL